MKCAQRRRMQLRWDELSQEQREQIQQHLQGCEPCRREEEAWHEFLAVYSDLESAESDPAVFLRDLNRRIETNPGSPIPRLRYLILTTAFVLAVGWLAWFANYHRPSPEPPTVPTAATELLRETQESIETRILDILDRSIPILRETEAESSWDEEIL